MYERAEFATFFSRKMGKNGVFYDPALVFFEKCFWRPIAVGGEAINGYSKL
jgi:hypothetical protein